MKVFMCAGCQYCWEMIDDGTEVGSVLQHPHCLSQEDVTDEILALKGKALPTSKDANFDWHKPGVWVVLRPPVSGFTERQLIQYLSATTPCGCRAEYLHEANPGPWADLEGLGYYIKEYRPT